MRFADLWIQVLFIAFAGMVSDEEEHLFYGLNWMRRCKQIKPQYAPSGDVMFPADY